MSTIRVGFVGLGANCRLRHVPGLREQEDVEIVGVANRSPESTKATAEEFGIPKTFERWEDLVADSEIDAVVVGTWPYLHCPITLAALEAGKHVLCEARMAMNVYEARRMLTAAGKHSKLVTQIVPSPFGFRAGAVVKERLAAGYIGTLREVVVLGTNDALADPETPHHWRQNAEYSGLNMLVLGILHETLIRWVPDPVRVMAQTQTYTKTRQVNGQPRPVETPDSVHVLTELPDGARGVYHLSSAIYHSTGMQIHLYGSQGTLKYELAPEDRLLGASKGDSTLAAIPIPDDQVSGWRVEEEFIRAIRGQERIKLTDLATGVRYMEFTEAVARSAQTGQAVSLPLGKW